MYKSQDRQKTEEIVYVITSLTQQKASPKTILKFSCGHWSIENGLHYVRDTSFREDHSQHAHKMPQGQWLL
ncbi:MAG: transposase [Planctomycetia bacterium]|nr:transposase [Planctomycetia bacterium]